MEQEETLRTYITLLIEKSNKPRAKSIIGNDLVKASAGLFRYSGLKRGAIRLVAADHKAVATDDQIQQIIDDAGFKIVKITPPRQGLSSKFDTYVIKDVDGNKYDIIVGIGKNEGQAYESEIGTELQSIATTGTGSERIMRLLKRLKINPNNVADVIQASSKRVRRPLTGTLENVGAEISDITIVLHSGREHYISLKAKSGKTFANAGYKGGFIIIPKANSVSVVPASHPLDEFVKALGIDKELAAQGYEQYANAVLNDKKPKVMMTHAIDEGQNFTTVSRFLESAFGYGYWYVREGKGGDFDVKDLRQPEGVKAAVGDIIAITVRYPGGSKQTTAKVETTENVFEIEIRNSQGLLDPNEIKVRIK